MTPELYSGLNYWLKISDSKAGAMVYGGDMQQSRNNGIELFPWNNLDDLFARIASFSK
jgi:hypothetical protein